MACIETFKFFFYLTGNFVMFFNINYIVLTHQNLSESEIQYHLVCLYYRYLVPLGLDLKFLGLLEFNKGVCLSDHLREI